jgi:hypothetical protein
MKHTTTLFLLLAALLTPLIGVSSESNTVGMTTHVTSASAVQTRLSVAFDESAVAGRIASGDIEGRALSGYGSVLAINGHGTPAAHVTSYTLGQALDRSMALDALEIPSSPDELVTVGTPAIMHELRVVAVNFQPVMRDADGTARVVRSIDVEVTTAGAGGENTIANPVSFSQAWYPVYRSVAANLDDMYPEIGTRPPGR